MLPLYLCFSVTNPKTDQKLLSNVMKQAKTIYPQLTDAQPVESLGEMIYALSDEIPVIDHVANLPGSVVATDFSGHGFGLEGPAGHLLAAQIAIGREAMVDTSAFRFARFDKPRQVAAA